MSSANIDIVEGLGVGVYTSTRRKERNEIAEALRNGVEIRFYYNFIEIGNKTYNGWDRWQVKALKEAIEKEEKK